MFEKFISTPDQPQKHLNSAARDYQIANNDNPEICFQFCYNCLIKLALAVCAKHELRVKSRPGHHVALIEKMSELMQDSEIEIIASDMRAKRNMDLYGGGTIISRKEAQMYLKFTASLLDRVTRQIGAARLF